MAAEGAPHSMRIQKGQAYSRSVRGRVVEMWDDFSSIIFVSGGWTDSINFVKDMIAEIFSIEMMSFWKNLDEGETERGPENGEYSFWAANCLP
jgi:hypothetical protein